MDYWGEEFVGDEEERGAAGHGVSVSLFTGLEGERNQSRLLLVAPGIISVVS